MPRKKKIDPLVGTLPPRGYAAWHEWAEAQYKAVLPGAGSPLGRRIFWSRSK